MKQPDDGHGSNGVESGAGYFPPKSVDQLPRQQMAEGASDIGPHHYVPHLRRGHAHVLPGVDRPVGYGRRNHEINTVPKKRNDVHPWQVARLKQALGLGNLMSEGLAQSHGSPSGGNGRESRRLSNAEIKHGQEEQG